MQHLYLSLPAIIPASCLVVKSHVTFELQTVRYIDDDMVTECIGSITEHDTSLCAIEGAKCADDCPRTWFAIRNFFHEVHIIISIMIMMWAKEISRNFRFNTSILFGTNV